MESKLCFYIIEQIDVANKNNKKYVCGTKVSTFENSGRKFVMEYYIILMNDDPILSQFTMDASQISFEQIESLEMNDLDIRLYASKVIMNNKEILSGLCRESYKYKGIAVQFTDYNLEENADLFKTLYKGV